MSIVTKIKNVTGKFNKIRKEQGTRAAFDEVWALGTYVIYDRWKIHRLKKFPPALHPNRMLFETNDDFTDNGRALFDYLVENGYNQKYELVWLVHDPKKYEKYQASNVKFVQSFKKGSTIRRAIAYRYALTSGYIFLYPGI